MKSLEELARTLTSRAPEFVPEEAWPCGCNGTGWLTERKTRVAMYCTCRTTKPVEDRLRLAGVRDERLLTATWDNRQPPIYPKRGDLAEFPSPKSCVTMLGPVGTGKGHVAVAIMREWILTGRRCRWVDVPDFIADLLSLPFEDREPVIRNLFEYDLAVLDEAYSQKSTPYADEVVSRIIRRRMDRLQPMIVMSNFSQEQLEAAEPRVCSRITGSPALAFDFTGLPDRRRS